MKHYYVEVYASCHQVKKFKVWSSYPGASLSPDLTMFFSVDAWNEEDAIAKCLCGEAHTLISPDAKQLQLA